MNHVRTEEQADSILRWGGLAGVSTGENLEPRARRSGLRQARRQDDRGARRDRAR